MTVSNKTQIKASIILQYLQMILSAIISLIYTPIMIRTLGQSEYGIYSLTSSFVSYLSLLSLGFSGSYLKFYSGYKAKKDTNGIAKLNGLFLITFTIISVIAFFCGFLFAIPDVLKLVFDTGLTNSEIDLAKILMFILSINIAVSLFDSVFVSYVSSQEKFVFQKILNMVKTVFSPFMTIPLLLFGFGSISIAIVTTSLSILACLVNILFCLFKLKMKFSFKGFDRALFKDIFIFSSFIAINQIVDQVNWQFGKIIIGRFKGSDEVAVFSTASTINTLYINLSTAISSVFAPRINRIVAEKKDGWLEEINNLFIKVGRIQFMFLMLILTGFIFFGQYFMKIWAGEGFENSYYVALLLICPATIALIQNLGIEVQRALNQHKFRSLVYLVMAALNITISIFLTQWLGAIGAALGTCISLIIANGLVMNIYYKKAIGIDIVRFWKSILKLIFPMILPIILGIIIMSGVEFTGLIDFGFWIVLYTAMYCMCMATYGFNEYERKLVVTPLIKIKNRIFKK